MNSQFITNKDNVLSDIINAILPKCDHAYFLVGYFYFSGFAELCEQLKDIKLRILVGLEVERNIINGIKEVENFVSEKSHEDKFEKNFTIASLIYITIRTFSIRKSR